MKYLKFGNSKRYIVFLHGWGADKNSFLWLKNYFFDYTTLFVDFSGFGDSCEPTKPFFVADFVEELHNLLLKFDIDELILLGHSFGGRVAIKYTFFYQNEYKKLKLCLVDSAGVKPRRNLSYYYRVAKYKKLKKQVLNNKKPASVLNKYGSSDYKKLSSIMKQTFVNVVNENLERNASFIKCETLIVWGEDDKETKLFMAKKLHKLIQNSKMKIIKNAGHFSFLDSPQEFLIILDTFIKN